MIALNAAYLGLVDSHKTAEHVSRRAPSSECRSCFVFARFSRRLVLTPVGSTISSRKKSRYSHVLPLSSNPDRPARFVNFFLPQSASDSPRRGQAPVAAKSYVCWRAIRRGQYPYWLYHRLPAVHLFFRHRRS